MYFKNSFFLFHKQKINKLNVKVKMCLIIYIMIYKKKEFI